MGQKTLTNGQLSRFCLELALLLEAGIAPGDGLRLMAQDVRDKSTVALLTGLSDQLEDGVSFADAVRGCGRFPQKLCAMVAVGEQTGRLDETLRALSTWYERQGQLTDAVRSAVVYPAVLLVLMAAVMVVLVVFVLPIFQSVFVQLGTQMSPFATALMRWGQGLGKASAVWMAVIGLLVVAGLVLRLIPVCWQGVERFFKQHFGGKGLAGQLNTAHFAAAVAMAMSSGLDAQQAITLAGQASGGSLEMNQKIQKCLALLEAGQPLEKSLAQCGIFSASDARLLSLGVKTGSGDQMMETIANRTQEKCLQALDRFLGWIEPSLVILISVAVGGILLSVMLPLMGLMSALG